MIPAIPHPDDPTRLLSVDDALESLWANVRSALALIESLDARSAAARSLISDLTARADGTDKTISDLWADAKGKQAALDAATSRVQALEDKHAADIAALKDRIVALEIKSKTGPAFGPDMSGWQTVEQVAAAAADPDVDYIILKATEGMSGRNDKYPAMRAAAGAKFIGAYHVGWANQDPAKEAANFLDYADLGPGHIAIYDGEDWGETDPTKPNYARDKAMRDATSWADRVGFQLKWTDIVKQQHGVMSYHNWSWIKGLRGGATLAQWDALTSRPLWIAEPTGTPGQHSTVTAKDGSNQDDWPILLHQYATKPYDLNWTPDLALLRELAVKG